ncbi:MAG TPA: TetR/AcrR family transcriptional regulator [Victivallales bacterium]|nr:TetR/AcrR family transcriptional regulator [Victivallales bacterium]
MAVKKIRPSADKTREKILKYALKLFAQKGYSATTVRDIAKAAKVNLNLIFHHFKSKRMLWIAVGELISQRYSELYLNKNMEFTDLRVLIEEFLYTRFKFYKENPEVYRLIRWKNIEPDESLLFTNSIYLKFFKPILLEFQIKGEIRSDIDVDFAALFMSSSLMGALDKKSFIYQHSNISEREQEYIEFISDEIYKILKA